MTGFVQHGTVVVLKNNEKSKTYKNTISLSVPHSACFVSGRPTRDGIYLPYGHGAVLYTSRQIVLVLF